MSSFKAKMQSVKVTDLPAPKSIITIKSDESFTEAFLKIVSQKILSAPVLDTKTNKYIGYLELRDLISIVISVADEQAKPKDIDELLKLAHEQWKVTDGITLTYMARRNPLKSISTSASLYDAALLLANKRKTHIRRVSVVDDDGAIVNVISQAGLVRYVNDHLALLGEACDKTVKDLNVGSYPAHCVKYDVSARDTFELLDKTQISGMAIINDNGMLFGNISGRDLKNYITNPDLNKLEMSIKEFLAQLRNEQLDIRVPTILCFPHTSFKDVVGKLTATKVHRLYVVDGEKDLKPIGVVAVSDVVAELVRMAEE